MNSAFEKKISPSDFLKNLPSSPGVYLMKDSAGKVIYVGKASSLKNRLAFYFSKNIPPKTRALLSKTFYIDYIVCVSSREALILEDRLVKKLHPFYNILLRDDKTYPYLKLSISEKYPSLSVARILPRYTPSKEKSRDLYFGPYPETSGLKSFAFWLNKTFGLKLCRRIPDKFEDRKRCLYRQTGECKCDCVSESTDEKEYKDGVRLVKMFFLKGKIRNKMESLLNEKLKEYSSNLQYEKAAFIRDVIFTLKKISFPIRAVREVDEKVYTSLTSSTENLEDLRRKLSLLRFPSVIECADISNIQGKFAVGSVVRFVAGEPDKDNYRRYRIKYPVSFSAAGGQNDFAMMEEVVFRRLSRLATGKEKNGIGLPDLFVVDGGAGQLSAALKAAEQAGVKGKIDIIAISKSGIAGDEIYFFNDKKNCSDIGRIPIKADDKSLNLISHIRDEAHRFALSYHKKLRDRVFKK